VLLGDSIDRSTAYPTLLAYGENCIDCVQLTVGLPPNEVEDLCLAEGVEGPVSALIICDW